MKKDLLHTPEGVRDIYSTECAEKKVIENRLHDVCASYGYNDIQTPSIEFFDVFNKERGSVPSNEMFKLFDRYGNTLVLRPDMTPSIARATAKYFEDRVLPVKLCYLGNTFINVSKYYQGRLKENTMLGAELINDNSLAADYEIISMVIDCMLSAGLTEFQVELGNVAFFNGLLHKAGITGDSAEELLRLIKDKNYFGVEELLDSLNIDDAVAKALLELPQLFGGTEVLEKAKSLTDEEECIQAVNRLEELYELLKNNNYDKYISFDLGDLSEHAYYTGIIFHAYTFGTGMLASGQYEIMAAVMAGGMVPPLAIAFLATAFPKKISKKDKQAAYVNYIMGLSFISEGAIPFASADPLRTLPAFVVGSAVTGALSMIFNCTLMAPHGGIFVIATIGHPLLYLLAIAVGTVVSTMIMAKLKKNLPEYDKK